MPDSLLGSVVVVLYEPQDPVNIAATVRAMKNMGVGRLRLVRPVESDVVRLEGIAHRTMDVIEAIEHFDSFDARSRLRSASAHVRRRHEAGLGP